MKHLYHIYLNTYYRNKKTRHILYILCIGGYYISSKPYNNSFCNLGYNTGFGNPFAF